jgi:hypothetical protein
VRENAMIQGTATANSFVKDGGTSSQFLMADGSVSTGGTSGSAASVTLGAIGTSSNANGATIAAGVLNLEPASASFGGVVTTGAQTFAGNKTFSGTTTASSFVKAGGTSSQILMADGSVSTGVTITTGTFLLTYSTQTMVISYKSIADGNSKIVYLKFPNVGLSSGVSTFLSFPAATLPASIRPSSNQTITTVVFTNPNFSNYNLGWWIFLGNGALILQSNSTFTGVPGSTISYIVD